QVSNDANSQSIQQNTTSIISEEEQNSHELLLATSSSSFELPNKEVVNMQIDDSGDSNLPGIRHLGYGYQYGIEIEKNAFELYKEAAEKGDINLIHQLGY